MQDKIELGSVLTRLGFQPSCSSLFYHFGNCKLVASKIFDFRVGDVYSFYGNCFTARSASEIEFSLPQLIDSFELALAYLSYNLKRHDLLYQPEWLKAGIELHCLLPWEQESIRYNKIPKAIAEHEWIRVLIKKLTEYFTETQDIQDAQISFDGNFLSVDYNFKKISIMASGNCWEKPVFINLNHFLSTQKRIKNSSYWIFVDENYLHFGNRRYQIINS